MEEIEKGLEQLEVYVSNKYAQFDYSKIDINLIIKDMRYLINEVKKLQKENKKLKNKGGKTNDKTRNSN